MNTHTILLLKTHTLIYSLKNFLYQYQVQAYYKFRTLNVHNSRELV